MSYAVTVSLSNVPATVRAGMTADVTITIDSATNVLTIPAAALRGTTGDYTVLILGADGTPTAQPVEVGLVTNTTAEIKSGLSVGQEVVTGVNTAGRPGRHHDRRLRRRVRRWRLPVGGGNGRRGTGGGTGN